jgi:hypothetical protein
MPETRLPRLFHIYILDYAFPFYYYHRWSDYSGNLTQRRQSIKHSMIELPDADKHARQARNLAILEQEF